MLFRRRARLRIAGLLALALTFGCVTPPAEATAQVPPAIAALEVMNVSCGSGSLTTLQRLEAKKLLAQAETAPAPSPPSSPAPETPPTPASAPTSAISPPPESSPSPTASPLPPLRVAPPAAGSGTLVAPPLPGTRVTPPPVPTPSPSPTAPSGPVLLIQATGAPPAVTPRGSPTPAASPTPTGVPTLGPNQYAILADHIEGSTKTGTPADAIGHVNIFYQDGQLVGDRAHYDGQRYIDVTGERVYLRNRVGDTVFFADSIRFDTIEQRAYLRNGHGTTLEGVERGALHFTAENMQTDRFGVTTGANASVTTCENVHGGYHIVGKSFDLRPDDRLIVRKATLYLGPLAVFYLPFLVIPLTRNTGQRRPTPFLPTFGYDQTEGFWMKSQIGFGTTPYYYGYYRLDVYTKLGLGIGYVAFFSKKNGRRSGDINVYRFKTNSTAQTNYNLTADETENFSQKLRSQVSFNYQGNYGPGIFLPPSESINGTVSHTGTRESQTYTFQRYTSGSDQSSMNFGFTDQRQLTNRLSNGVNITYSENLNAFSGVTSTTSSLHLNTLTHYTSPGVDYDLTFDRTESATPFGIEKLPELTVRPHAIFPNERIIPVTAQFVVGEYAEPSTALATQAAQGTVNIGPALFKVFHTSDFSATMNVQQYYFGTGDLKALITQNMSLTTPFGPHVLNAITYNESNSNGPLSEPFQTFDILGTNTKGAQDVLRVFNRDIWGLTLTDGTNFNGMAQPVSYQLVARPSFRSSVVVGGTWVPGPGNGFGTTNVQIITPISKVMDLQFATNVDWKNKGRLEDKTIFYRVTIADCYQVLASYNEDLKQVNVGLQLLAFPSQQATFGLSNQSAIVPQSFSF